MLMIVKTQNFLNLIFNFCEVEHEYLNENMDTYQFSCYNYWKQPIHVPINVHSLLFDPQEHFGEEKHDIMVSCARDNSDIGGVTKVIKSGDKSCEKINVDVIHEEKDSLCSENSRIICMETRSHMEEKQRLMSLLKEKESLYSLSKMSA